MDDLISDIHGPADVLERRLSDSGRRGGYRCPGTLLLKAVIDEARPRSTGGQPVFAGPERLRGKRLSRRTRNVACFEWSVANGRCLCAYSRDGEQTIDDERFVSACHCREPAI
jgi:hypothetical protein